MEELLMKIAQNQITTNELLVEMQRDIGGLKEKTNEIERKLDNGLERLEEKIDRLEAKLESEVARLERKLDNGLKRLDQKLDENLEEIADMFNEIYEGKVKNF